MKPRRLGTTLIPLMVAGVTSLSCGEAPQTSETKTNWLMACDTSAECGGDAACLCGICSSPCTESSECDDGQPPGVCGSRIGTASQCARAGGVGGGATAEPDRLCLPSPDSEACESVPLPIDTNLGSAITPDCDHPGALICEGFDAPLPEETSTWDGDAEAELQSCEPQAGDGSLRYTGRGDASRQTRIRMPSEVDSGTLYSRFYLNVSSDTQIAEQLLFYELWHAESMVPERITLGLLPDSSLHVYVGAEGVAQGSGEGASIQHDRWICVELNVSIDDATGSLTVDVDGERMVEMTNIDTRPVDPYEVAVVQMLQHDGVEDSYADFMFDELYVGTEVIGCN